MELDPQTALYLQRAEDRPHWEGMPVAEARALARAWHLEHATFDPKTTSARRGVVAHDVVASAQGHHIPIRLYRPPEAPSGPLPAVVFFHGGGWVIGDLETHDELCRELSWRTRALVAAVDYRRAPESTYPAAVDDCRLATQWLASEAAALGIDASRLAVAGDSAGGNLATAVARWARDQGAPRVAFQLLIYPVTDNTRALDNSASAIEYGSGLELTLESFYWFQDQYFGNEEALRAEPDASPLYSNDLTGIAPALVLVADLDPIADSVLAYASKMAAAGVDVKVVRFPGLMHAFVTMGSFFDAALDAIDVSVAALADALGTKSEAVR